MNNPFFANGLALSARRNEEFQERQEALRKAGLHEEHLKLAHRQIDLVETQLADLEQQLYRAGRALACVKQTWPEIAGSGCLQSIEDALVGWLPDGMVAGLDDKSAHIASKIVEELGNLES